MHFQASGYDGIKIVTKPLHFENRVYALILYCIQTSGIGLTVLTHLDSIVRNQHLNVLQTMIQAHRQAPF